MRLLLAWLTGVLTVFAVEFVSLWHFYRRIAGETG